MAYSSPDGKVTMDLAAANDEERMVPEIGVSIDHDFDDVDIVQRR